MRKMLLTACVGAALLLQAASASAEMIRYTGFDKFRIARVWGQDVDHASAIARAKDAAGSFIQQNPTLGLEPVQSWTFRYQKNGETQPGSGLIQN